MNNDSDRNSLGWPPRRADETNNTPKDTAEDSVAPANDLRSSLLTPERSEENKTSNEASIDAQTSETPTLETENTVVSSELSSEEKELKTLLTKEEDEPVSNTTDSVKEENLEKPSLETVKSESKPANEEPALTEAKTESTPESTPEPVVLGTASAQEKPAPEVKPVAPAPLNEAGLPIAEATPEVLSAPVQPKKKKTGLIALLASVLFCGILVALYFFWYQNPNKIIDDALIFNGARDANSITMKIKDDLVLSETDKVYLSNVKIEASVSEKDRALAYNASFDLKLGGQSLPMSAQARLINQTVYFKLGGLNQLANIVPEDELEDDADMAGFGQFLSKFQDRWIKISPELLSSGASDPDKDDKNCFEPLFKLVSDENGIKQMIKSYQENRPFVFKSKELKDGDFIVDVEIDAKNYEKLVSAVFDYADVKKALSCQFGSDFDASELKEDLKDAIGDVKALELRVGQFDHTLKGLAVEVKGLDSSNKTSKIDLSFSKVDKLDLSAPSDTIDLEVLMVEVMTELFGGAGSGLPSGTGVDFSTGNLFNRMRL